jgi:hypothetical protein
MFCNISDLPDLRKVLYCGQIGLFYYEGKKIRRRGQGKPRFRAPVGPMPQANRANAFTHPFIDFLIASTPIKIVHNHILSVISEIRYVRVRYNEGLLYFYKSFYLRTPN